MNLGRTRKVSRQEDVFPKHTDIYQVQDYNMPQRRVSRQETSAATQGVRKISKQETVSQNSLLSAMNRFVCAVEGMEDSIMIPRKLVDIPTALNECDKNSNSFINEEQGGAPETDLFTVYSMLKTIKTELVRGPVSDDEDEIVDEKSKKIAAVFRQHLKGLFTVLEQLTEAAECVQHTYQNELTASNTSSSMPGFQV